MFNNFINDKYVLLRVFSHIFHMIFLVYDRDLYDLFNFHLCMYMRGFFRYIFVHI